MGFFSRKKAPQPVPSPQPVEEEPVVLPRPIEVHSEAEANQLMNEIGERQRRIMLNDTVIGAGDFMCARVEGVVIYSLNAGKTPESVFDVLVDPIAQWGLGRFFNPWLEDQDSAEGQGGRRSMDVIMALRNKYQYLNPHNLG